MSNPLSADDRLDIGEVIARYAWALDTADVEAFLSCFTPDAVLIWDAFEAPDRWTGAEGLRTFAEFFRTRPNAAGRQHHVGNLIVKSADGGACATSYCMVTDCKGEPPYPVRFTGYYEDELVKRDGRWQIRHRWIRDWSGPVLKGFPGQAGQRVPRQRPAELARPS